MSHDNTAPDTHDLQPTLSSATPAVVMAGDDEDGRLRIRPVSAGPGAKPITARLAVSGGYRPTEGDRVLVLPADGDNYVVGVLHAARPTRLELPDGASVELQDGVLELRDGDGRLLVRHADGDTELCAPTGDLTLAAPHGRVRVHSALDVELSADRDVVQRAGRDARHTAARSLELSAGDEPRPQVRLTPATAAVDADRIQVQSKDARIASRRVSLVAHEVANTVKYWAANVEHYELTADRLVERSRNSVREVAELFQTSVGRARHLVRTTFSLRSRRSVLRSKKDTSIDGKRIRLG